MTISGPGTAAPSDPEGTAPIVAADPGTDASAVLATAQAAFEGEPAEDGVAAESPSVALAELVEVYPELSDREQVAADELLARPDGTGPPDGEVSWNTTQTATTCDDRVCVHYVTKVNDPDRALASWAEQNLTEFESVWDFEVSRLGYRAPPADSLGGGPKFDVYLADLFDQGYYGYCAPEQEVQRGRASSYCVLDNDFDGFARKPVDNLKVTAAHEFFHAVQYSYDYAEDKWLMEATATWIEERYADAVNDNRQYLRFGQLGKPSTPMDTFTPGGLTHYGNWLFFERFSQKYGVGAVRALWNRLDASPGAADQYSIQAVKGFLAAHGTSLPKFYAHYAAGNLAPSRAYSEGSAYRATKFADAFKLKQGRKSIAPHEAKLKHLTSKSYRFKPTASLPGKAKLRIVVDGPDKKTAPAAVAYVYFKSGRITKKFIKLNKSGAGSARIKFSSNRVSKVTLSLVNASTRFDCWGTSNFSCQGYPRDNASKFTYSAKVVK